MCFNSHTYNLPPLFNDGAQLSFTDSFKHLGMGCDRRVNLNTAADAVLHPFSAGTLRFKQFIWEHDLTNRLYVLMWILRTYAIPAGMYASQFLETPFLLQGKKWINLYKNGC